MANHFTALDDEFLIRIGVLTFGTSEAKWPCTARLRIPSAPCAGEGDNCQVVRQRRNRTHRGAARKP